MVFIAPVALPLPHGVTKFSLSMKGSCIGAGPRGLKVYEDVNLIADNFNQFISFYYLVGGGDRLILNVEISKYLQNFHGMHQ